MHTRFADRILVAALASLALTLALHGPALGDPARGPAKPMDSVLRVAVGEMAPDFTLPDLAGTPVRLRDFRARKNVVLSFVPAAWTPVCSDQWPGYNLITDILEEHDAVLLGITVDNTPSQRAWVEAMGGLRFTVLSDFWPHGAVADTYGILRSSGEAERALFVIDKQGVLRFIEVHDINTRPDLGLLVREVEKLD
ncbi:MAG: peroxiredoxin [Pseudodesulfovibrio sp.]|uniref:Alkyl hydroperoxide reductase/ Thiol specific antioxidant/ Mal allergen n=1 Tax=Pseudodesulfovibrio aespoeensis (strain ATCC 700646 / DSM 10631 / Aspo-2) TaxID=643562 RepID=E6VV34_PSEA9|nr:MULTISPECIES: peroxiredoxin [Pseudodesulfovibrio]MBU4244851.1 peroxiredoxin [Pseudomonadota bacterium]ADU61185.1 alkyl hydroperoxide reductase/ Thiol specific antioxidant/ Mal allergen [Pseudodesulfovibrio aespoeensis Aspo-2]MBU4379401.1 peroxiredoxin [Pseudomonadota bacterium]MBU4476636.1 peroxiredoxin [Pseudomonadota bacterium]MBU4514808.1 peroxiredoxin [Pseudomonadota bacterium]